MLLDVLKIFAPATAAFFIGILVTPIVTHYLYKYKCWKKRAGNTRGLGDDKGTPIFNKLHKEKDINTPRMGGLVLVISVILTVVAFWLFSYFETGGPSGKPDFLSRTQTWLPFAAFLIGAFVGFVEDIFQVQATGKFRGGLPFRYRVTPVLLFGIFAAWWFYAKLGIASVFVPFIGPLFLGLWFIPFFLVVLLGVYSSAIIDGLDGLSGGVMSVIFAAYGLIAFLQDQINLAAFSLVIVGGLLAFLWFNIPPARFYLGEAGFTSIALTLTVIAFMTDKVLLLPVIAFIPTVTVLTNIIQVASKKFRGKKVFLVAPIHHHFEALGWPAYKVVMRYWIVSVIAALIGILLAILG